MHTRLQSAVLVTAFAATAAVAVAFGMRAGPAQISGYPWGCTLCEARGNLFVCTGCAATQRPAAPVVPSVGTATFSAPTTADFVPASSQGGGFTSGSSQGGGFTSGSSQRSSLPSVRSSARSAAFPGSSRASVPLFSRASNPGIRPEQPYGPIPIAYSIKLSPVTAAPGQSILILYASPSNQDSVIEYPGSVRLGGPIPIRGSGVLRWTVPETIGAGTHWLRIINPRTGMDHARAALTVQGWRY